MMRLPTRCASWLQRRKICACRLAQRRLRGGGCLRLLHQLVEQVAPVGIGHGQFAQVGGEFLG
jgi:hypothetical protein